MTVTEDRTPAGNTGFVSGGLSCRLEICALVEFNNELKLCAPKPARTQSPEP